MAIAKQVSSLLKDKGDKKPSKGKDFMHGLKEWVTSPGGIATLLLFVGALWYIHSKTAKGAKA